MRSVFKKREEREREKIENAVPKVTKRRNTNTKRSIREKEIESGKEEERENQINIAKGIGRQSMNK